MKPEILRWKRVDASRLTTHIKWPDGHETHEGINRAVCKVWRRDARLFKNTLLMALLSAVLLVIMVATGIARFFGYINSIPIIVLFVIVKYISIKRDTMFSQYEKTAPTALLVTAVLDGRAGETDLIYKGPYVAPLMKIIEHTEWVGGRP